MYESASTSCVEHLVGEIGIIKGNITGVIECKAIALWLALPILA
jgi:hypothetical protein